MGACWDNKIKCCKCDKLYKDDELVGVDEELENQGLPHLICSECSKEEVFYLDCYKCGKEFDMDEEHGSTNIIKGNKNNIKPIHFCGNCWDDEVDKSVENEELGCMIYKQ